LGTGLLAIITLALITIIMPLITLDLHAIWDLNLDFLKSCLSIGLCFTLWILWVFLGWIVLHLDGGSQL